MLTTPTRSRLFAGLSAIAAALALGACAVASSDSAGAGASGADAVLAQTFTGAHKIQSGVLDASLTVTPSGSGILNTPLSLTIDGPFQANASGKRPAFDLTATISALGQSQAIGLLSTGSAAYVTFDGADYAIPAGALAHIRSAIAGRRARRTLRLRRASLAKLGLDPYSWLVDPTVVSTNASVDGVQTTDIHAAINLRAVARQLLGAISANASTVGLPAGVKLPATLPARLLARLGAVHPTIDVFTGNADHTLHKFVLNAGVPLSGRISQMLGGLTGAQIALSVEIDQLNQPQTITAPSSAQPISALEAKVQPLLSSLGSMFGARGAALSG
jgi:hypothetical protein